MAFLGPDTFLSLSYVHFWYFLLTQVLCPLHGTVGLLGNP